MAILALLCFAALFAGHQSIGSRGPGRPQKQPQKQRHHSLQKHTTLPVDDFADELEVDHRPASSAHRSALCLLTAADSVYRNKFHAFVTTHDEWARRHGVPHIKEYLHKQGLQPITYGKIDVLNRHEQTIDRHKSS